MLKVTIQLEIDTEKREIKAEFTTPEGMSEALYPLIAGKITPECYDRYMEKIECNCGHCPTNVQALFNTVYHHDMTEAVKMQELARAAKDQLKN